MVASKWEVKTARGKNIGICSPVSAFMLLHVPSCYLLQLKLKRAQRNDNYIIMDLYINFFSSFVCSRMHVCTPRWRLKEAVNHFVSHLWWSQRYCKRRTQLQFISPKEMLFEKNSSQTELAFIARGEFLNRCGSWFPYPLRTHTAETFANFPGYQQSHGDTFNPKTIHLRISTNLSLIYMPANSLTHTTHHTIHIIPLLCLLPK